MRRRIITVTLLGVLAAGGLVAGTRLPQGNDVGNAGTAVRTTAVPHASLTDARTAAPAPSASPSPSGRRASTSSTTAHAAQRKKAASSAPRGTVDDTTASRAPGAGRKTQSPSSRQEEPMPKKTVVQDPDTPPAAPDEPEQPPAQGDPLPEQTTITPKPQCPPEGCP